MLYDPVCNIPRLGMVIGQAVQFSAAADGVGSRSDSQLRGTGNDLSATSDCAPEQLLQSDGSSKLIMPCGLIAWSFFNDTYAVGP